LIRALSFGVVMLTVQNSSEVQIGLLVCFFFVWLAGWWERRLIHAFVGFVGFLPDAIDNIGTKVELLAYCVQNNIKVFSSMGAGAKADPTRIQIADLSATHYDPLARAVRQRLRANLSKSSRSTPPTPPFDPSARSASASASTPIPTTTGGGETEAEADLSPSSTTAREYSIPVVYSTEVPSDVALLPLPDDELAKGSVDELAPLRDFRVRILPVLGPLPGLFGLHIATYVLCELAGRPIERPLPVRHRKKLYERMWKDLLHRESRIARKQIKCVL
jgi:tRNA threonylcarbamoyladenosine dehydratase